MSVLKFGTPNKGTVRIYKAGRLVAAMRKRGQWTLSKVTGALTMDDLANIRAYVRELA